MTGRKQRKSSTSGSQQLDPPTNCLSKCQYEPHASLVLRCASTGNLDLFKHCLSLCSNPWNIRDGYGRNVLLVAASCGHLEIILYLLKKKERVRIDSTDLESRWSALHRAAYLGYVGILVPLIKNGGNLELLDFDKFSPLNILHYNMETINKMKLSSSSCLYVWGTNSNMTLGHDHVRTSPEVLDLPHQYGNIKQAVICKFHSVFLSEKGAVYTCGHGHGGRLGHGNDKTCLAPKLVQALKNQNCTAVAAARDHTVFLTDSGVVYTCGLNDAHQLGQTPKNHGPILPFSLAPFYIRLLKALNVLAIGAGRYHTAVCTKREVYTFGKNLGQLGYAETTDTQIQPKIVTGIHIDEDDSISHFSVSDAATACLTKKKRLIYVCAKYTVLRCERLAVPETLSIVHFMICASMGELQNKQQKKKGQTSTGTPSSTTSGSGLTLGLTDSNNQLWLTHWTDFTKKSCTSPQLIPGSTKRNVIHFAITKNLTVVTPQGEVFTRPLSLPQLPSLLSLKRVSNIQQVQKVFTDYKTNNMAVIQNIYNSPILPKPDISTFNNDIYNLLTEESLPGSVYDITFDVMGTALTANKLVLSSQSKVFSSLFNSSTDSLPKLIASFDRQASLIHLTCSALRIFELFLQYLYGGHLTIKPLNEQPTSTTINTASNDSPPSTTNSKTSLDESIDDPSVWNHLYDKFGKETKNSFDIFRDAKFDEDLVILDSNVFSSQNHKPSPVNNDKGVVSVQHSFTNSVEVCYETNTVKEDLSQLRSLAVTFKVYDLVKQIDSALSSHCKSHSYSPSKSHSYSPTKFYSCIIKGPQVSLDPQSVPHDAVIISQTGTSHFCHKCVLVSRSDYFQSMLLMGWKETASDEHVTPLNLPMSDVLIEMVIEYLYTDQFAVAQDLSSLEWLTMALTTADQLLLKRLKTICELNLANILALNNVGYIIDLSEVYNAEQLQDSCVQFVCLNLPALLEMGGLEGVSVPILRKISNVYREMFPEVSKRKGISFKELSADEIPSAYLSNEMIESTDDETEDTMSSWKHSVATTPISRAKSPFDTPTSGSKTTPTSNSARKKRRKKGSGTKETPRQLFSPATSPEPKLPKQETDELECLDKIITDFVLFESTKECNSSSVEQIHDKMVENNLKKEDIDHGYDQEMKIKMAVTENVSVCSSTGAVNNETIDGQTFNDGSAMNDNIIDKDGIDKRSIHLPWGNRKKSSFEDVTSFKEIMETEKTQRKNGGREGRRVKKGKNPKQSQPIEMMATSNPPPVNGGIGIVRSMSLPVQTGRSPSQPWGLDVGNPSSTVSLRTLMAEAEAETQEINKIPIQKPTTPPRVVEKKPPTVTKRERLTSFPPLIASNPVVSFTDIVNHQQSELDQHLHKQSHRKQLQLIQIEEEAIQNLLTLYNASNNLNEYITVERVPVGVVKSLQTPSNRRTSAPYTGTRSAWDKKTTF